MPGGRLAVEVTDGDTAPVLAIHGISSQRRLWDWLRDLAPTLSLVAPDLRGRGDSVTVGPAYGLCAHTDDMIAVLDALAIDRALVCGMSMGGFVAVDLAVRHPDRVAGLVLVDGGLPMAAPPGLTREALPALFADRLGRLEHAWASPAAYRDFFVGATAPLLDPDDTTLDGYLAHDLDAKGRVRLSGAAVLTDAADVLLGAESTAADRWRDVAAPTRLLHAEWGHGAGERPPAYSPEAVEAFATAMPALVATRLLPGADHAASIMTKGGAAATLDLLTDALG